MQDEKKLKICFVVTSKLIVRFFLVNIINSLAEKHEIILLVNDDPRVQVDLSSLRAEIRHVRIERAIDFYHDFLALIKLVLFFRRYQPDVVQSISPKGGLLAMIAGFLARIPVRSHVFTGQVWETRQGLVRFFLQSMDKVIAILATQLLADSKSQRQHLVDAGIVAGPKIKVLANGSVSGVDTAKFAPNPSARAAIRKTLGLDQADYVFLFVGRLTHDKGVLDLAHAFVRVAAASAKAQLLLVGPDEEGIAAEVRQVCAAVAKQLHIVSYTETPENYMAAADVLCLPSYREGFGSVVIEAAAAGIPAIASEIYGITDAVVQDRTGILFPPGDVLALARTMARLLLHQEEGRSMGEEAMQRARKDFSRQVLEQAWVAYCDGLANPS